MCSPVPFVSVTANIAALETSTATCAMAYIIVQLDAISLTFLWICSAFVMFVID